MTKRTTLMSYVLWVALPLAVAAAMLFSRLVVGGAQKALHAGASSLGGLIAATALYTVTIALIFYGERIVFRHRITKKELGLEHSLRWREIGYGAAGFAVFMIAAMVVAAILKYALPGLDWSQAQNVGFRPDSYGIDRIFAFVTLVVVAPVAEEIIFRGYLYGALRRARMPMVVAAIAVSLVFAILHGQANVGVVTFVLGLVMCGLRQYTNSLWPGIIVHGLNNLLTFYVTFVWL